MPFGLPSSANTISLRYRPGEDLRTFPTSSQSIFTHGNYRLERDISGNVVSADTTHLRFDGYESLSSMNLSGVTVADTTFVHANELNLRDKEISGYVYFGSLKMEAVVAMSNIIENWPYAILSSSGSGSTATTIYDYSAFTASQSSYNVPVSTFFIPYSAVSNMGGIILTSGSTLQGKSLLMDTQDFVVQISGDSAQHQILNYSFSAGSYLSLTVMGYLFTGSTFLSASSVNVYIRPTDKRVELFKKSLSPLEYQILYRGVWIMPNPYYDDGTTIQVTYTWPKTIDGFNPDISGIAFESYRDDFLDFSERMDKEKTDVLIRSVIPENYLELDSEQSVYRNIVQAYAHEFDLIKRYIDGLAFAHAVTYDGQNNVPDKFLYKLTQLLGLKLARGFTELDLFSYLSEDIDGDGGTVASYNLQVWRRILVNIIWLFKKKRNARCLDVHFPSDRCAGLSDQAQ